jgi:hypothetical protein
LLTVSIPDLKPNSQDTSAFYLENIYQLQVSGSPNVSHSSIPSALATPPAFSPPNYAVWVNSLWFLSLLVSLSGAMMATTIRNWAIYYIELTQWPWDTLAKRARMRALFAKGKLGPEVIWGTGDEPIYLHFALLLFIAGGLIYLFNTNRAVFYAVVWWVGYMTISYTRATVAVFFEPHSLFHTPLSPLALRIYLGISHAMFQIFSHIPPLHGLRNSTERRYHNLRNRYGNGFLNGKRKEAEEIALKPSSEIDALILERILPTLDEDGALETFFEAIPGFCNSKLSVVPLSFRIQMELRQALDCFLDRTFSSNLVSESVRASRLTTCLNAAQAALGPYAVSGILDNIFNGHWDGALQSVEIGHAMRPWGHGRDRDLNVRRIVACIIARARRRDDRWTMLVKEQFGVPDHVLRDSLAHGNSVLLSILIHISRQANRASYWTSGILSSLSKFDIRHTLPALQHEFCLLWNEITQDARNQGSYSIPALILGEIRHLYVALHQGTGALSLDSILDQPFSYPLCDIASHRPAHTTQFLVPISGTAPVPTQPGDSPYAPRHQSTLGGSTALRLEDETNIITRPPSPPDHTTTGEIEETSQAPTATFPVHSCPSSSYRYPRGGVAIAQPDTTSATKLSLPLESNKQEDLTVPCAASLVDINKVPSTTHTALPEPAFSPPVLNKSFAMYDPSPGCPAFGAKSLIPASSNGFSAPDCPPPPHAPPWLNAELVPLLSGLPPKGPSDNSTLPRLHTRRIVNNGNMNLANAVLQLLVYCPPSRDLFRDIGRLVGQREEGGIGGSTTPLMDATVRFLDGFEYKKSSPTHPFFQQADRGNVKDEDGKKEEDSVLSFLSTYIYDTMKEKRQFITMRVRSCAQRSRLGTDPCWPIMYRMAGSRMQRCFWAFASTRLMKNWSLYALLLAHPNWPLL